MRHTVVACLLLAWLAWQGGFASPLPASAAASECDLSVHLVQRDVASILSQVSTLQVSVYLPGTTQAVAESTVSAAGTGQQTIGPLTVPMGPLRVVVRGADFQGLQLEQGTTKVDVVEEAQTATIMMVPSGMLRPLPKPTCPVGTNPQSAIFGPTGALYVDGNPILGFSVGDDGALSPLPDARVPDPRHPGGMAVDPQGQFLYVTDIFGADVQLLEITPGTGALTPAGTYPTDPEPVAVTTDASGDFVYVANVNNNGNPNPQNGTISVFKVDRASKTLVPLQSSVDAHGQETFGIFVDSTNSMLFVSNQDTANFAVFRIDQGTLDFSGSVPQPDPGGSNCVVSPDHLCAYLAANGGRSVMAFSLEQQTIGQIQAPEYTLGDNPAALAMDPQGRFLFVSNQASNTVAAFLVRSDGTLEEVTGMPFATGLLPATGAVDPSGRFLYVPNLQDGTLSLYSIAP